MLHYFDIHSHLNFSDYDQDREEQIKKLEAEGIGTITIGTSLKTSKEAVELSEKSPNLFASIGAHPADGRDRPAEIFDEKEFEKLVTHPRVVAIGECGLDYAKLTENVDEIKKRQKEQFEKQIAFAVKYNKPLMIHCRDAYDDCLAILESKKGEYGDKLRANFHFFTEPIETAQKILDLGFKVSFTGPITSSSKLEKVVKFVPLEKMMAETDAPFAAPHPYRGQRNESLYVKDIVAKIARIKKLDLEEVKKVLVQNALRFFSIQSS